MKINDITGFMDIDDHGLLFVRGPDAKKFLQGQVTCDIEQLMVQKNEGDATGHISLGAHCTHKGRMLFSFIACAWDQDTVALSIHKDLLEPALGYLKKYSIFSKVELIDASSTHRIIGFIGSPPQSIMSLFPVLPLSNNDLIHNNGAVIINRGNERYECWLTQEQAAALSESEAADIQSGSDVWAFCNIQEGVGEVRAQTSEEFIPQMLNYQVVATGISFQKGCYTGQEVVARMQYLGKLKRRMHRFSCNSEGILESGLPLFTPEKQQSIGNIVMAANYQGQQEALAVVTEEAISADAVYIDEACQQKLKILELPYTLTEEE